MTNTETRANVRAILAASRGRGFRRRWIVAGFGNSIRYTAAGRSNLPGAVVSYPARMADGSEYRAGLSLTMHRERAKAALRAIAETAK